MSIISNGRATQYDAITNQFALSFPILLLVMLSYKNQPGQIWQWRWEFEQPMAEALIFENLYPNIFTIILIHLLGVPNLTAGKELTL